MADKASKILAKKFVKNNGNLLQLRTKAGKQVKIFFSLDHKDKEREVIEVTNGRFYSKSVADGYFNGPLYEKMSGWILLRRICDIVLFYRPFCIVEIGAGESTKILAEIAEKEQVKLYSCDVKAEKKCNLFPDHIFALGSSEEFMKWFDDTPAIVLIDGDHRYDTAKMEFDFFFEKLIEGGVIFLHDTFPPGDIYLKDTACGDVYLLRQELEKRTNEMDVMTFPYTAKWMGLTMVMKKGKDRPYWGE